MDTKNIGRNLAILMFDRKVTARDVAEATGVTEGMISHIKNGLKIPSLPIIINIANYFSVSVDELLKGNY